MKKTCAVGAAFGVCAVLGASSPDAQDFPTKPIRILVRSIGGSGDFSGRLIGQGLTNAWGQQVVIDNRGNFDAEVLWKALPDGYTLMIEGAGFWISPLFYPVPYDVVN